MPFKMTALEAEGFRFVQLGDRSIAEGLLKVEHVLSALRRNPAVKAFVKRAREYKRAETEIEFLTRSFGLAA